VWIRFSFHNFQTTVFPHRGTQHMGTMACQYKQFILLAYKDWKSHKTPVRIAADLAQIQEHQLTCKWSAACECYGALARSEVELSSTWSHAADCQSSHHRLPCMMDTVCRGSANRHIHHCYEGMQKSNTSICRLSGVVVCMCATGPKGSCPLTFTQGMKNRPATAAVLRRQSHSIKERKRWIVYVFFQVRAVNLPITCLMLIGKEKNMGI
jgi:hypothetical protein